MSRSQTIIEETKMARKKKTPVDPEALKTVKFTADPSKKPAENVRIGMVVVPMPDAATQRAGWTSEYADLLAQNVKGYKIVKPIEPNSGE
jgi:hypothetical protein